MNNKKIVKHTYKLKRGNEDILQELNPMLLEGEPIVIFNNDGSTSIKIGDGIHSYCDLKAINANTEVINEITDNMSDDSIASAKAIYNYVRQYVDTSLKDINIEDKIKQSDYCENDVDDPAYIKNRLFWKEDDILTTDLVPKRLDRFYNISDGIFAPFNFGDKTLEDFMSVDSSEIINHMSVNYNNEYITKLSGDSLYTLEADIVTFDDEGNKSVIESHLIKDIKIITYSVDEYNSITYFGTLKILIGDDDPTYLNNIEEMFDINNTDKCFNIFSYVMVEDDVKQLLTLTYMPDISNVPISFDDKLKLNYINIEWRLYCQDSKTYLTQPYEQVFIGADLDYDENVTYYKREEIFEEVDLSNKENYNRDTLYFTYDNDTETYIRTPYIDENTNIDLTYTQSLHLDTDYDLPREYVEVIGENIKLDDNITFNFSYVVQGTNTTNTLTNLKINTIPVNDNESVFYIGNANLLTEKYYSITIPSDIVVPEGCEKFVLGVRAYNDFSDYESLYFICDPELLIYNGETRSDVLINLSRTVTSDEINKDKTFFIRKFTENIVEDKSIDENSYKMVYIKYNNGVIPYNDYTITTKTTERFPLHITGTEKFNIQINAADYNYVPIELDGTNFDSNLLYYKYDTDYYKFEPYEVDSSTTGTYYIRDVPQYTEINIPNKDLTNDMLQYLVFYKLENGDYVKIDEPIINDEEHKCTIYTRGEIFIKDSKLSLIEEDGITAFFIGNINMMTGGNTSLFDLLLLFTNDWDMDYSVMFYFITTQLTDYNTCVYIENGEHIVEGTIHKLPSKYIDNVKINLTQNIDSDSTSKQVASAAAVYEALEERGEFNRYNVYNYSDEYPSSSAVYNFAEQKSNKLSSYDTIQTYQDNYTRYPSTKHVYQYVEERIDTISRDYSDLIKLIGSGK